MLLSFGLAALLFLVIEEAGYVLDSSGYGLAAFRVAGALAPSRGTALPSCCHSNYLSEAHTQLVELLVEAHEVQETPLITASFFAGFLVSLVLATVT